MKILISFFTACASVAILSSSGQMSLMEFTYTAINNEAYTRLDSIKIRNISLEEEIMVYWPDTVVSLDISPYDILLSVGYATCNTGGVKQNGAFNMQFRLFQNTPNPVYEHSEIHLYIPGNGLVNVMVNDLQGRMIINSDWQLEKGTHILQFTPGCGNLFLLTARWNGIKQSIKILTMASVNTQICTLKYSGRSKSEPSIKSESVRNVIVQESGILDYPVSSKTYTFQFVANIPCPGIPTIQYEGQIYNTIQIFSQCWMKENLNVGSMKTLSQSKIQNDVIYKQCYNDEPDSCTKYGGLYDWHTMMQFNDKQGKQTICPPGWHPPTDEEWKVLEGAVDSHWGIGDPIWDETWDYRGIDVGKNLKTTKYWHDNGNGIDLFGFSGLPGGWSIPYGGFTGIGEYGLWWTSTEIEGWSTDAWFRSLSHDDPGMKRYDFLGSNTQLYGLSVRCIKDLSTALWSCGDAIIDTRDGQAYQTIGIGNQCWMAENMNIGTMIQGSNGQINNSIIEKYCYDNSSANCDVYGGLYQWDEMMQYVTTPGVNGICPEGWHLPTDAVWTALTTYLGGESVAGGKMKEAGLAHWASPNTGATNESGFTALPGGYRSIDGSFLDLTYYGYFWSSTESNSSDAWLRRLYYPNAYVDRYYYDKSSGQSVRCLQD